MATSTPDPFTAMGGGIQRNGGWIMRNAATQEELDEWDRQQAAPTQPGAPPPPAPTAPTSTPSTPDPFEAMGGGIQRNGGWIMRNMATPEELAAWDAQKAPAAPVQPGAPPPPAPTAPTAEAPPGAAYAPPTPPAPWQTPELGAPPAPAGTPIEQQAQNSQTYSQTPGSAPTDATTNQGTQDVLRNTYLERATQPRTVGRDDPAVQAQVNAFAGQQERGRRQYLSEAAERASARGLGDSGALDAERRFAAERAGEATGSFEAQLVGQEIKARRAEIDDALQNLKGMLSADQAAALQKEAMQLDAQMKELGITTGAKTAADQMRVQKEIAEIDAALKRLGIETGAGTAGEEIGLKRELGLGGLNIDLMRLLMQDRQFADTMGFNVADRTAFYNNQALQNMMPR
jgi:hypothetical protein